MSDTDDAWFNLESVYAALADNRRIVPTFKAALADAASVLDGKFSAGVDVEALVHGRARFVDELLRLAWSRFEWNENRGSFWKNRISLLAVGGYGRGELHPCSDIDLLILLERPRYQAHRQNIQSFITMLWDLSLIHI